MRKHNQVHTLDSLHKVHFQFLKKLKDFKCALWYEKYGTCKSQKETLKKLIVEVSHLIGLFNWSKKWEPVAFHMPQVFFLLVF